MLLSACSPRKELIVLLPEEGGKVGAVIIKEKQRTIILDAPLDAATINAQSRVQKDKVTQQEANKLLTQVQDALPLPSRFFRLYFPENSTEIAPESLPELTALLDEVAKRRVVEIEITGHTDHIGSVATNDHLSQERAEAVARTVRSMLEERGLQGSFIRPVGRGSRQPLIPPESDQKPEPKNRRVEVIVR
jgi:outer membrane protein OmpA-like peptidoglycan-associated protein